MRSDLHKRYEINIIHSSPILEPKVLIFLQMFVSYSLDNLEKVTYSPCFTVAQTGRDSVESTLGFII